MDVVRTATEEIAVMRGLLKIERAKRPWNWPFYRALSDDLGQGIREMDGTPFECVRCGEDLWIHGDGEISCGCDGTVAA